MTMAGTTWGEWRGRTVVDQDGKKIGKVDDIYTDEDTNAPEWLTVTTGLFGKKRTFVPLSGAAAQDEETLRVPYTADQVKDAPRIDPDGYLARNEEDELYRHYGLARSAERREPGYQSDVRGEATTEGFDQGRDVSGPTTDNAMTRSEERLRVGKQDEETGRVRLRKWVETEHVTQTVPVRRERVSVEREPITDANIDSAMDGPEISEEEHEVTLHEERPVVATEAVPVERVRLNKEAVTEQQEVGGEVRKERIETEGLGDK